MKHWLVKSDPDSYGWEEMKRDRKTDWDGVRNYQARNNLKEMKKGDKVLFYHSVKDKTVVGVTEVSREFYQDPTTDDERWVAVELTFSEEFKNEVSLKDIKGRASLSEIALIRQSRLSVMPLTKKEFTEVCKMGGI